MKQNRANFGHLWRRGWVIGNPQIGQSRDERKTNQSLSNSIREPNTLSNRGSRWDIGGSNATRVNRTDNVQRHKNAALILHLAGTTLRISYTCMMKHIVTRRTRPQGNQQRSLRIRRISDRKKNRRVRCVARQVVVAMLNYGVGRSRSWPSLK